MGKRYTRVHRLLQIISLLQSKRGLKPADLSKLCETSLRTIYRDVVAINAAGIPCGMDDDTDGYTVGRGYFMPPVDLTTEEALALIGLIENCSRPANIPFMHTAARAVEKIRSQLPAKVIDQLQPLDQRVHIALARGMADDSPKDVYELMRHAIATKRALRCRYDSNKPNDNPDRPFVFKPYILWYCQRAWYIVGQRDDRDGPRQLKLSRFTSVKPTDKPYFIPDDFNLAAELGHAWRMIRDNKCYDVVIRFKQPFAETVSETRWHPTQEEEWSEDRETVILRFNVDGLKEIVWWILGYGPGAEVLDPPELREKVRELLTEASALYVPKKNPRKPKSD